MLMRNLNSKILQGMLEAICPVVYVTNIITISSTLGNSIKLIALQQLQSYKITRKMTHRMMIFVEFSLFQGHVLQRVDINRNLFVIDINHHYVHK